MALRFADQAAFLGIGLWNRTDDSHAAGRRFSTRGGHAKPRAPVQREHRISVALPPRTQPRWPPANGGAFHLRVSFRLNAVGIGPHIDGAYLPESDRCRTVRTLMKGLAPLFLGIFGTFAFSWVGL